ncbi:MAG: hypothetical protein HYU88_05060 [Chloroflexi bacterium]|nr:hypothetical protein [Chloroflexota bacterium]
MADTDALQARLEARPVVAVLPPADEPAVERAVRALLEADCAALVVPWPPPRRAERLATVRALVGDAALVGMSAVPGPVEARQAVRAGAQLVISAALRPAIVPVCHQAGALCALGALTPTEALSATEAAADYVRVGPLDLVGGPAYLAALRAQFPWIAWLAAGEIAAETLFAYRATGAALFELGTSLLPPLLLSPGQDAALRAHVGRFLRTAAALPPLDDAAQ